MVGAGGELNAGSFIQLTRKVAMMYNILKCTADSHSSLIRPIRSLVAV